MEIHSCSYFGARFVSCSFENVRHFLSKFENSKAEKLIPFEEIKVNAAPVVWKKEVHPFLGATPIDIDGDGIMEIFVGGGDGQEDLLLSYKNNELVNIIAGTQLIGYESYTWSKFHRFR